jgi:Family of unknown function (DUF5519)
MEAQMSAATDTIGPFDRLNTELTGWPGVTTGPGRFGSTTYFYGSREIGHLHGNSHADLPFPTRIRHELVASGAAEPHHYLPESGWVTVPLAGPDGIGRARRLFERNYDLILRKKQPPEVMPEG